ncbi:MAG: prolipoprotein diacylglyceryl transferase [Muribaculaceae bacterium]|nr:prolipoprotein diacylglyceryl transferase [Muribaculaceae bacterium]MCM1441893.1 prolipoprotein diacylglyceryl transferase [Roseburia sp.]
MAITINPISPVAFSVLGVPVRWYALAYIAAFICGYFLFKYLMGRPTSQIKLSKKQLDDLLTAVILGVILGGRLGYVLFYNLPFFIAHPLEIFAVWHGGMSFHGGLIGVITAVFLFAWNLRRKQDFVASAGTYKTAFRILDIMAVVVPIGFFFGRIANFINMEIMGRPTTRPWGVLFAGTGDIIPRHPSPLYEAAAEGVVLFVLMFCLYRFTKLRRFPGAIGGVLGMAYAILRIFCEQFRAPDAQIGFLTSWGLTMGQLLSGVMFIAGATIFFFATHRVLRSTKSK